MNSKEVIIPGYEHPSDPNLNRNSVYKTFSENVKKKSFGNTTVGNHYASQEFLESKCPKCKMPPSTTCPCIYNDKTCVNNHTWYTDREGVDKMGKPPH